MRQNNSYEISPLDHIAEGVEIKYDLLTGYTQAVIQGTAVIARELGISEDLIRRWAKARQERNMSRISRVCSLVNKLESDYPAQLVVGLNRPCQSGINTINASNEH